MSPQILPPITAGIAPEKFSDDLSFAANKRIAAIILGIFLLIGFTLRVHDLGAESLGEDELNKLQTVQEYRTNGLSGKNGEHPFLMKGLQTASIVAAEKINGTFASANISDEAALRFPVALFGTFSALLIFLLASELFGRSIGLLAGGLWAVEPLAISFDRIAKEDSLALFFFLLTLVLWVRGQSAAERGDSKWIVYAWGSAVGFAAMMASKYYPHMLAVVAGYYSIFQGIPSTKWRIGKVRYRMFFALMGIAFVLFNPTILLPDTWHEMLKFSSEQRIGHDSYEFWGTLYQNKMTAWFAGNPWPFYYVLIAVKTSLPTLVFFMIGLPMLALRKLGDGRFLILTWGFLWFMPFTVLGGKFTRYFAMAEPLIVMVAAIGVYYTLVWLSEKITSRPTSQILQWSSAIVLIAIPLWNSAVSAPHFRMFTNTLGGGPTAAGSYFPHDEFYDAATSDILAELTKNARNEAVVACETPTLFEHYAEKAGRPDLNFVSLSEPLMIDRMSAGDYIVLVSGRRYKSNQVYYDYLGKSANPSSEINIMGISAAKIYLLDAATSERVKLLAD